jgi:hypothetical protein
MVGSRSLPPLYPIIWPDRIEQLIAELQPPPLAAREAHYFVILPTKTDRLAAPHTMGKSKFLSDKFV